MQPMIVVQADQKELIRTGAPAGGACFNRFYPCKGSSSCLFCPANLSEASHPWTFIACRRHFK